MITFYWKKTPNYATFCYVYCSRL